MLVRYSESKTWPAEQALINELVDRVFPEPLDVLSIDAPQRTARISTTRDALDRFANFGVTLTPVDIHDRKPELQCFTVYASPPPRAGSEDVDDGILMRAGAPCPPGIQLYPQRQLVVEGLDERGRRLFATAADDPRWRIVESVSPSGQLGLESMGRTEALPDSVNFRADVTPALRLLRVWQIDHEGRARALVDIPWVNVEVQQ